MNDQSALDTSLEFSNLGEAFLSFISTKNLCKIDPNGYHDIDVTSYKVVESGMPDFNTNLAAVQYGFTTLLDVSSLAFASTQFFLPGNLTNSTQRVDGIVSVGVVRVCSRR